MAGKVLLLDFASTIFFFALYSLTGNLTWSVTLSVALAIGQMGWRAARRENIDALQWISLLTVISTGVAAIVSHNPLFFMLKVSIIYLLTGFAMLQRGWMLPFMPPRAVEFVSDLIVKSGYAWAGLMFFLAALNLVLATNFSFTVWGTAMSVWSLGSKMVMFFGQYGVMRMIGRRRARAKAAPAQPGNILLAA